MILFSSSLVRTPMPSCFFAVDKIFSVFHFRVLNRKFFGNFDVGIIRSVVNFDCCHNSAACNTPTESSLKTKKRPKQSNSLYRQYCSVPALIFFRISALKTVLYFSGATVSKIEKAYAKRKICAYAKCNKTVKV